MLVTRLDPCTTGLGNCTNINGSENQSYSFDELENTVNIKAYPNPFKDAVNIEFSIQYDSKVTVEIFNLEGQRISTLFEGNVISTDKHRLEFKPKSISHGMLIYRLQTEREAFYGKIIKLK